MTKRRRQKQPQSKTRRLRKQPKMRRVQAATAVPVPQVRVPKTAKRRRRRNRRRWRVPTAAIRRFVFSARWISLSLFLMTTYALVLSGLDLHFYLTSIPVEGAFSIPPAEIVGASGLGGSHVFAADPNDAAARIDAIPGVISATVTLGWPSEVFIRVKEDTPVAVWQEGDTRFWVTANGRLIPARIESMGLLVIESEVSLRPQSAEGNDEETADGSTTNVDLTNLGQVPAEVLAGALHLRELNPALERLTYQPSTGLSFEDERGWMAHFGTGTNMEQKTAVYEAIITYLETEGLTAEYIGVSNQEKPYYLARE